MNYKEELEIRGLKAFRDSIDNTLKEYLSGGLSSISPILEDPSITGEKKAEIIVQFVTDSIAWRCEYEIQMQWANLNKMD